MGRKAGRGKGIAEIAHLYLSETRGPAGRGEPAEAGRTSRGGLRLARLDGVWAMPRVTAVVGQGLGAMAGPGTAAYAEHVARGGQRVGVVRIDAAEASVELYEAGGSEGSGQAVAGGQGEALVQRGPGALDCLAGQVDRVLVLLGSSISAQADRLLEAVGEVCILAGCDEASLTLSYRLLKRVAQAWPRLELSFFLVDADSADQAERTAERVIDLSERFLGRQVVCEGWSLRRGWVLRKLVARQEHGGEGPAAVEAWLQGVRQMARCEGVAGAAGRGGQMQGQGQPGRWAPAEPLLPIGRPLDSNESLYEVVLPHLPELADQQVSLTLRPPSADAEMMVRLVITASGQWVAIVVAAAGKSGVLEAGLAALGWAEQVVAVKPAGRHLIVVGTELPEATRLAAERLAVPTRIVKVRQFWLEGRLGVWLEQSALEGCSAGAEGTRGRSIKK